MDGWMYGCRGQTPADAEYHYLEHAKRLEMYGAHLYPAQLKASRESYLLLTMM